LAKIRLFREQQKNRKRCKYSTVGGQRLIVATTQATLLPGIGKSGRGSLLFDNHQNPKCLAARKQMSNITSCPVAPEH
jgi:hypothetical protein